MIVDALLEAIRNSNPLRVRYFGGSSPGAERDLQPLSLKDGKVRARCLPSGEIKTFAIDKMELAVEGVPSALASAIPPPAATYSSIDEFMGHQSVALQEMGWVLQRDGESISLHRTFKNGKLIQTPDVALQFVPVASDLCFDGEEFYEANVRERSRPWIVRAKNHNTKTFGDFAKAQVLFLEFARLLAPKNPTPRA